MSEVLRYHEWSRKGPLAARPQDSGATIGVRCEEVFRAPRLMRQIIRLWHHSASQELGARLYAYEVMRDILHTLAQRTDGHRPPSRARERLAVHTVRRLRDYVEHSLADELDVMAMAEMAALSPAHFARSFAATVGVTPFHYVVRRRLARAYELLERTERSVLDVAVEVGFKTQSHFTARFRREFGVTPRDIRSHVRRPDVP
jgi:transcriptional regulator GlxA family with amidase domain